MAITDIPILSMLRTRLQWSQERQRVLAENVANADTPNYRARDLAPPKFEAPAAGSAAPVTTVSLARTDERPYRRHRAERLGGSAANAAAVTRCARPAMP